MRKEVVALEKLVKVNAKALAYAAAVEATQIAQYELDASYLSWKLNNRVHEFVERDSYVWKAMMLGTDVYYRHLRRAKARERRAKLALLKAVEVS